MGTVGSEATQLGFSHGPQVYQLLTQDLILPTPSKPHHLPELSPGSWYLLSDNPHQKRFKSLFVPGEREETDAGRKHVLLPERLLRSE